MEIRHLREAVTTVLKAIHADRTNPDARLLIDTTNDHYQYAHVGWNKGRYNLSILIHIDITQNLVWVQADNTESRVVDALLEQGVPKNQIVLGFQAPQHRKYTGFATGDEAIAV